MKKGLIVLDKERPLFLRVINWDIKGDGKYNHLLVVVENNETKKLQVIWRTRNEKDKSKKSYRFEKEGITYSDAIEMTEKVVNDFGANDENIIRISDDAFEIPRENKNIDEIINAIESTDLFKVEKVLPTKR